MFLGVKPQMCAGVLEALSPALAGKVLVSMAAGLTTATLAELAGGAAPVLRIMPNTPAAIGRGMIALCGAEGVEEAHFAAVERILSAAGRIERLPEGQMDAFSAVAGCGPAFVYQFIEALADGGVMAGLPRKQAQTYAAQTLLGAAAMVLETGGAPRRAEGRGLLARRLHHRRGGGAGAVRLPRRRHRRGAGRVEEERRSGQGIGEKRPASAPQGGGRGAALTARCPPGPLCASGGWR